MTSETITIRVELAWWLRPFLWLLETFCLASGGQPDPERLEKVIKAAIRYRVE
jgi:hypothetical protein